MVYIAITAMDAYRMGFLVATIASCTVSFFLPLDLYGIEPQTLQH